MLPDLTAPAPPIQLHEAASAARPATRPEARGKFFWRDGEKVYLRGVTYGPFAPGPDGQPYDRARAARDFEQMARAGVNVVRLYTPPPTWLLDLAAAHEVTIFAGLAWEQHITFLEDRRRTRAIARGVRDSVEAVAGHPALLGWAIGNEIPASIVRWHGPAKVRGFLAHLYEVAKGADPDAAITYVNYPTTEYLELDFLDFFAFNVFLEQPVPFARYLERLQNLADDRPLVLTEIGLDSGSHGEQAQADAIDWQVRAAFAGGCAGAFVFSWTDEWHRGGAEVSGWHFGLTDRERVPRPALARLSSTFQDLPLQLSRRPPSISVVICTYNGGRTLEETCSAVTRLDYPNMEVIVVDDGSTDSSADIARRHGFTVLSTPNRGLSSARNTGVAAASGEIVAFLDDDAMPDPHWLAYLADAFTRSDVAAVGGPNLPVPGDGAVADSVAASPGNPIHVLIGDCEAEHIPGCNSAFRVAALRQLGGFDPQFRVAGDDVDLCWRLQDRGWRIGYSAAAVVWHHRRRTVGAYLRQQRAYGRAEALLERKWPARYSPGGHVTWRGRVYGEAAPRRATGWRRWRVYQGVWGTAPFQSLYDPAHGNMNTPILMPELYLGIGLATVLLAVGLIWTPLLALAPLLVLVAGSVALRATTLAIRARFPTPHLSRLERLLRQTLTALLHALQPLVRLEGRLRHGLTPWRSVAVAGKAVPLPRRFEHWSESWLEPAEWVRSLEGKLLRSGVIVRRGGEFDSWDLETRGGVLAGVRATTAIEEHGQGRQLVRLRCRPTLSVPALGMVAALLVLAVLAAVGGAGIAAAVLAGSGIALALRTVGEAAAAQALTARAFKQVGGR